MAKPEPKPRKIAAYLRRWIRIEGEQIWELRAPFSDCRCATCPDHLLAGMKTRGFTCSRCEQEWVG